MSELQQPLPTVPSYPFRLDVPLHSLLQQPPEKPSSDTSRQLQTLPVPVFPQQPELIHELDAEDIAAHDRVLQTGKRYWPASRVLKSMRGWMLPYFKSRVLPGDFQPIIAYLFAEWKCNLDCHYCWSYDNRIKGMTEDTARRAIDWLHTTPCRVLAPTGGEPLLRPDFVHKVIYYAAKKDFWVYLATNARLLRPPVIDHLADAGIATINFAVDTVKERPGLPKAFEHVRTNFDYLVRRQYRYGYTVFFNTNICRTNIDDVKQLVEIAHDNGISLTFHINEAPMMEQPHFKHLSENDTYIRPEDFPVVDDLDPTPAEYEGVHAWCRRALGLPRRPKLADHSHRRNACSVFPYVQRKVRLGRRRESEVRSQTTRRNEARLRASVLLNTGLQRGLLLRRLSCYEMAMETGIEWLSGCYGKF
jgi:pyruvate-formate lyase-activating enzyme